MASDPACAGRRGRDVGVDPRRQRRPAERVRLHQGRTRQQVPLRHADRAGGAGSERLPLHAARRRPPRDAAARGRQQRQHAAQRPRHAGKEPRVQPGPAGAGDEEHGHVQRAGGADPVQVRRAPLDARLRRRRQPSLLRGERQGRHVRAAHDSAGHLHDRSGAREARPPDADGHARREGREGNHVHVQARESDGLAPPLRQARHRAAPSC